MKNKVLQLLTSPPTEKSELFNAAILLFATSPGVPQRQLQHFNANGFSNARLESLLYELKKLHNITEMDIHSFEPVADNVQTMWGVDFGALGADRTQGNSTNHLIVPAGDDDDNDTLPGTKTFLEVIMETVVTDAHTPEGLFVAAPDTVKEDIKLRDEFPFLKNIDCPDELKVLVSDKLTHYHAYVDAHRKLLVTVPAEGQEPVAMTEEEIFDLAKQAVENFTANQDIYAELEAYKNTGKVLGQHPKLRNLKMRESIEKMSPAALVKRLSNLKNYINRESATLKKTVEPEDKLKIEKKIEGYKVEQELVKAKLDPDDKK